MERSGKGIGALEKQFPKLQQWLERQLQPTFKQLEAFAKANYTSALYLTGEKPPEEPLPIPDFRTVAGRPVLRPSGNLLDTIYLCQQRQYWYEEYLRDQGFDELSFPGSVSLEDSPVSVASQIRKQLQFDVQDRANMETWEKALTKFIDLVENAGVMVMRSSIVKNNAHRKLLPEEFRGFALADSYAPLIFINGADSKSAQMFTLAHELAHIWLGETGLSNPAINLESTQNVEAWCNAVAAELLVPMQELKRMSQNGRADPSLIRQMARRFKVSTLVIVRRFYDAGALSRESFERFYEDELSRVKELTAKGSGGGDFYRTQSARISERFAKAIIASALEGQTSFRDAMLLTGLKKMSTFDEAARRLGVVL